MRRVDSLPALSIALVTAVAFIACYSDTPNGPTAPETEAQRLLPPPTAPGSPTPSPTPTTVGILVLPADTTIEVGDEVTFRVIARMFGGGNVEVPNLLISGLRPAYPMQSFSVSPPAPSVLSAVNVVSSARAWGKGMATVTVTYDGRIAYSRVTVK